MLDAGHVEELARCSELLFRAVFVRHVDDLTDARLDDELGALIAREHRDVERAATHVCRVLVQNCVHLRMAHYGAKGKLFEII